MTTSDYVEPSRMSLGNVVKEIQQHENDAVLESFFQRIRPSSILSHPHPKLQKKVRSERLKALYKELDRRELIYEKQADS